MTLEELSEKTGISVSHLSRLEADNVVRNRTTTLTKIEKIAHSLGVCAKDIIFCCCFHCDINDTCPQRNDTDIDSMIEEKLNLYL